MSVVIRPVQNSDAPALYAMSSDERVAYPLLLSPALELSEIEEQVQKSRPGQHRLVAEKEGQVAGYGSLQQFQNPRLAHTGQIELYVQPALWEQGIGSTLMVHLLDLADNWLNLQRLEVAILADNEPALQLCQKFGFQKEGLRRAVAFGRGRLVDDFFLARLRQPPSQLPPLADQSRPRPAVRGGNWVVRPPRPGDIPALNGMFRDPLVARTTLQMPSLEMSKTLERYKSHSPGIHRLVAADGEQAIGMISLHGSANPRLAHAAGLGMMVHPAYWGRGVGTTLMIKILDLADNWLNLKRVDLDVNSDNPPAIGLYEKFGFVIEGQKHYHTYGSGRWAHSYFMARIQN